MSRFAATLEPFRHRNFRRLWTATFFATGALWIQQALGWVFYDVTKTRRAGDPGAAARTNG